MLSADLKYKITIEVRTEGKDTFGAVTETWSTLAIRRASVRHFSGSKDFEDDISDTVSSFSISFVFRYVAGLNYKCRIQLEDNIYQIQDIQVLRRREGFKVLAERRETNG